MNRRERACVALIVALALALRLWALGYKPAHFDEGVNGFFIDEMRTTGFYHYDPTNYHGPLHFYVLFAAQQLLGRALWVLRLPTVLASTAAVVLVLKMHRFLPFRTVAVAAVAMAISPAMVFYARYAIHESWLPFFSLLALLGGLGLAQKREWHAQLARGELPVGSAPAASATHDLWAFGLGLAGMVLTKETYLLHCVAAAMAMGVVWLQNVSVNTHRARVNTAALFLPTHDEHTTAADADETLAVYPRTGLRVVAKIAAICAGIVVAFYAGFGLDPNGVSGLWETWLPMLHKGYAKGAGTEEAHSKELLYYMKLLFHYEWPALLGLLAAPLVALRRSAWLAAAAAIAGAALLIAGIVDFRAMSESARASNEWLAPHWYLTTKGAVGAVLLWVALLSLPSRTEPPRAIRFLALYGLASFAAYSLIPYKTPWCSLAALCPLLLVLGWLADRLMRSVSVPVVGMALAVLFSQPAQDMWELNFGAQRKGHINPTNDKSRYAYVQTTFEISKVLQPLRAVAAQSAVGRQLTGHIFGDAFPLRWQLGDFPNVQFWDEKARPPVLDADFLLITESRVDEMESELRGVYFSERVMLRDGAEACWLYFAAERFAAQFPGRTPELHPRIPLEEAAP